MKDLKFPFTDLTTLGTQRDQLLHSRAEHTRVEQLQTDLTAERTRLLGTGRFEDEDTLRDLSALQLKLDLIPAKLRQLENLDQALTMQIMAESIERFNELHREGGEVRAAHRRDIEDSLARLVPRSVDYRDGVTGKVTKGGDTTRFDRAVANLLETTEITRLVNHALTPISYSDNPIQRIEMLIRAGRLLVKARQLLGQKSEVEASEIA